MTKALEEGFVQAEVEKVAKQREHHVKTRKEKIVGTNFYANVAETSVKRTNGIMRTSSKQSLDEERIAELKAGFSEKKWLETALAANRATAQEIMEAMKGSGSSIAVQPIRQWRLAAPFEQLRQAAEACLEKTGRRPTVALINLGTIPNYKARADFITGFFEAGGFAVVKNDGSMSAEEAVAGALALGESHYVVCGTDESYVDAVPTIAAELKKAAPHVKLYVAGKQESQVEETFVQAGVDGFIHIGSNCYEPLVTVMNEMGVALDE